MPFFTFVQMPEQIGEGDYVEDDLDGVSGLPDGLALFRKNLDEPLADICRVLGPKRFLATVHGASTPQLFRWPVSLFSVVK